FTVYLDSYFVLSCIFLFFLHCSVPPRDLPSFPTRRSSDLPPVQPHRLIGALIDESRLSDLEAILGHSFADRAVLEIAHGAVGEADRKSTRLNSSHLGISYAVFCLKKKKKNTNHKKNKITTT